MGALEPLTDHSDTLSYEDRKALAEHRRQARRDKLMEDYYSRLYSLTSSQLIDPRDALRLVLDSATSGYDYDRMKRGWMEANPSKVHLLQTDVEWMDSLPPRPIDRTYKGLYDPSLLDGERVAR